MKLSQYNYNFTADMLAKYPAECRDESRLMVLNRRNQSIEHRIFRDVIDYLNPGDVLVINGDMPLVRESSLLALLELHRREGNDCTVLTYYESGELPPFGRVLRGADGRVCDIREYKDASEAERAVRELNGGVYVFDAGKLFACLKELEPSAATGEYYLTDVPKLLLRRGGRVNGLCLRGTDEFCGVNTPDDLLLVEEKLRSRKRAAE